MSEQGTVEEPRAACPECGAVSTLAELVAALVVKPLVHCPRCEIGSPAKEWKEAR